MTLDLRERGGVLLVGARVKPRSRAGVSVAEQGLVIGVGAAPGLDLETATARLRSATQSGPAS